MWNNKTATQLSRNKVELITPQSINYIPTSTADSTENTLIPNDIEFMSSYSKLAEYFIQFNQCGLTHAKKSN